MVLKNITIKREVRKNIYGFSKYGESVDETVNRLMKEAGNISDIDPVLTGSTGIRITPETLKKLEALKLFPDESYSSVFERLFKKIEQ